jgi:hypothetical protein
MSPITESVTAPTARIMAARPARLFGSRHVVMLRESGASSIRRSLGGINAFGESLDIRLRG